MSFFGLFFKKSIFPIIHPVTENQDEIGYEMYAYGALDQDLDRLIS